MKIGNKVKILESALFLLKPDNDKYAELYNYVLKRCIGKTGKITKKYDGRGWQLMFGTEGNCYLLVIPETHLIKSTEEVWQA